MPNAIRRTLLAWLLLIPSFVAIVFLSSSPGKANSMSRNENAVIQASCRSETTKGSPPDGLCALFAERLALAFSDHEIRPPDAALTDAPCGDESALQAILVILQASPSGLQARLDWLRGDQTQLEGTPWGTAMADRELTQRMLAAFLDDLIMQSPPPPT